MNDKESGYLNILKFKYRRGDQMIQTFFSIGSPHELGSPLFNLKKFEKSKKLFVNHKECIEV